MISVAAGGVLELTLAQVGEKLMCVLCSRPIIAGGLFVIEIANMLKIIQTPMCQLICAFIHSANTKMLIFSFFFQN